MRFLIITHVEHKSTINGWSAYAPYVREMNLWLKHVDSVTIVAPKTNEKETAIDIPYKHDNIKLSLIPTIQFTSLKNALISLLKMPFIMWAIFKACKTADHIHLRCPGNIGLLGCFVQILFPSKVKTAKYAGNWDPKAKQPLSYKLQKWLLKNTFLTKKMQVLVYGEWEKQTKNIKPFFTATFLNSEREIPIKRDYSNHLKFVFVGSLVKGKRPLLTINIIKTLHKKGKKASLDLYGDGILKTELQDYVLAHQLDNIVTLHGNQEKAVVKKALQSAHFSILPSQSEGWPKALAEAMFFGAIPIATSISCVPYMLDFGKRGLLIAPELESAIDNILDYIDNSVQLEKMSQEASKWSQKYTLDVFESEIVKLLKT